jgi:hypothetical protein
MINISQYIDGFKKEKSIKLLKTLLTIDLFFIVAHIIFAYLRIKKIDFFSLEQTDFSLAKEGSHSEVFQYIKELFIAVTLATIYLRSKFKIYGVWSLFFMYVLIDDIFSIHERFGKFLAGNVDLPSFLGLEAKDLGELFIYAIVGTCLIFLLLLASRENQEEMVNESQRLAFLVGVLIAFGLGFDMLHALASESFLVSRLLGVIEDGGEMIAMSLLFWYTYNLWKYSGKALVSRRQRAI